MTGAGVARRRSWNVAGLAALCLLGAITGVAAWVAAFFLTLNRELTSLGYALLFTVLTLPLAAATLATRRRTSRAFGFGLAGTWAIVAASMWIDSLGTRMSDEELDEVTARLLAAGTPVYYLGDEAQGESLSHIDDDPGRFGSADVGYGRCRGEPSPEAGCHVAITVHTSPTIWFTRRDDCERLESVLGVPAVLLNEGEYAEPVLTLFSRRSMIRIAFEEVESDPAGRDLEAELALARTVRPLGRSEASETLPPPGRAVMTKIKRLCEPPDR